MVGGSDSNPKIIVGQVYQSAEEILDHLKMAGEWSNLVNIDNITKKWYISTCE